MTTATQATFAVDAVGLSYRYSSGWHLGPLTFTLRPGVTGLVGPNGAGKSTLLRILATAERRYGGELQIGRGSPELRELRRRIGYLPQNLTLPGLVTVRAFVEHAAWLRDLSGAAKRRAAQDALEVVELADVTKERVRSLSDGMQRRLAFAAAIVGSPDLLILDEPTTGLDPRQRLLLRDHVTAAGQRARVLISSHLAEDIRAVAEDLLVIRDGRFAYQGTVAELSDADQTSPEPSVRFERRLAQLVGDDQ